MNHLLYEYSLCTALALMLFFGFYFILAQTPDKSIFNNYLRSRRTMGAALLVLSANYAVHLFCGIRFTNHNAAILMNLSTYFLCYWLFSSALTSLLDRFYITRRRLIQHITLWCLFTILSGCVLFYLPCGIIQNSALLCMATWLFAYGIRLARRLILAYRHAVRFFDDTHSDDIGAYIRWLSIFTYWAVIFGVGCGLLTFLPDRYIFIWILSSIPFYIYLYHSYMNYLLFYEPVERVLEEEAEDKETLTPSCYTEIAENIKKWLEEDGFIRQGLTIKELSEILHTNRTYLSSYIKATYHQSFRDWITTYRIVYAKRIMLQFPEQSIAEVSEESGFLSLSHFIRIFKEKEGLSPAKWKKSKI